MNLHQVLAVAIAWLSVCSNILLLILICMEFPSIPRYLHFNNNSLSVTIMKHLNFIVHGYKEHGVTEHEDKEHGDAEYEDKEHVQAEHGVKEHEDKEHGDADHGDKEHGHAEHGDKEHGVKEYGDKEYVEADHVDTEYVDAEHGDMKNGDAGQEDVGCFEVCDNLFVYVFLLNNKMFVAIEQDVENTNECNGISFNLREWQELMHLLPKIQGTINSCHATKSII
jgi:hypothetical protein